MDVLGIVCVGMDVLGMDVLGIADDVALSKTADGTGASDVALNCADTLVDGTFDNLAGTADAEDGLVGTVADALTDGLDADALKEEDTSVNGIADDVALSAATDNTGPGDVSLANNDCVDGLVVDADCLGSCVVTAVGIIADCDVLDDVLVDGLASTIDDITNPSPLICASTQPLKSLTLRIIDAKSYSTLALSTSFVVFNLSTRL